MSPKKPSNGYDIFVSTEVQKRNDRTENTSLKKDRIQNLVKRGKKHLQWFGHVKE
jgi:hypothetical protein